MLAKLIFHVDLKAFYEFASIQRGLTFSEGSHFQVENGNYLLKTSALSCYAPLVYGEPGHLERGNLQE
jgi:hypothetical protein